MRPCKLIGRLSQLRIPWMNFDRNVVRLVLLLVSALGAGGMGIAAVPRLSSAARAASQAQLPFVSCRSDGQVGRRPGPRSTPRQPSVPSSLAPDLAYYASAELSVVAPRHWHCFGYYGSGGATLFVTPMRLGAADLSDPDKKLSGPAVELDLSLGTTSGRFKVAQVAARLFPRRRAFVRRIIREGVMSAHDFPFGPSPHDSLTRRGNNEVEFVTPARMRGMGTVSRLAENAEPIHGLAIMTKSNNLLLLDVRTRPNQRQLVSAIIAATRAQGRAHSLKQ